MIKEYVADFETINDNLYDDKQRVWLWAVRKVSKLKDEFCMIGYDIESFMKYIFCLPNNSNVYFHNLKFDGDFIVNYLLKNNYTWVNETVKKLNENCFTTNVSFLGQVYSISAKINKTTITFRDSLKLFQSSEKRLAKDYKLDTVKGEIDYKKQRPNGYRATKKEIDYIKNDVYIIAYILATFREQGFKKYTSASSALYEFIVTSFPLKNGKVSYKTSFKMFKEKHPITKEEDTFCRKAYNGGFCYVNPIYKGKTIIGGCVYDVNSMYPAQMRYRLMPYGKPLYYIGKYLRKKYEKTHPLYIQRLKVDFKTKKGYPPLIQNKGRKINYLKSREYITDTDGEIIEITLTSVDLAIFLKSSNIYYIEYIDGYCFKAKEGSFFISYIERFLKMKNEGKIENNASKKQFGKLYLNSLYGKMASKLTNFVMSPYIDKWGHLRYKEIDITESEPIYIPIACFITAYGRQTLYNAIIENFDRFLYCDTDSIHLKGAEEAKGIEIDKYKLGAWDCETILKRGKYLGAKCYIEETITDELIVHCAGLTNEIIPDNVKTPKDVNRCVTFENFKIGAKYYRKRCYTGIDGKYIDYQIFEIRNR